MSWQVLEFYGASFHRYKYIYGYLLAMNSRDNDNDKSHWFWKHACKMSLYSDLTELWLRVKYLMQTAVIEH